MNFIPRKIEFPNQRTRAYELLELIAICGELPTDQLSRLSGGVSYKETLVTSLKKKGFIKTYYADGMRGLRLTNIAKKHLLEVAHDRFSFYLKDNAETNHVRSHPTRRERLCRIAEATITMMNAGVNIFRDERPTVFTPTVEETFQVQSPAFYPSREIKDIGFMFDKAGSTRAVGVVLTKKDILLTYNIGDSLIQKWGYKVEKRAKTVIEYELTIRRMHQQYNADSVKGLVLANSMALAAEILKSSEQRQYFLLDDNFEHFYFVTNDIKGEMLLRLICDHELGAELDELLTSDLYPADNGSLIDHDAITEDGEYVLLSYKCDLRRIRNFDRELSVQKKKGIIYCFDYQAEVIRPCCSDAVEFQTLDYKKTERRFFS